MNPVSLSASLSGLQNSVGIMMLKKALDTEKQNGQNMAQMLNQIMNLQPGLGNNVDIRA